VTARHRAPALPLFALFAAAGAWPAFERWRGKAVAAGAALVVALNIPAWETQLSYAGELDFYRGLAATDLHRMREAREVFARATTANPHDARAWFELGNILDGRDAIDAWLRAAHEDPWDLRASRRAAQALVRLGDVDGAIAALQASIDAHARPPADYAPDHLNLAFMRAERGQPAAALAHLRAAARADLGYVRSTLPRMAQVIHQDPGGDPAFVRAVDELQQGHLP
jgi:tetratricopeptide (TPR) repeat protein